MTVVYQDGGHQEALVSGHSADVPLRSRRMLIVVLAFVGVGVCVIALLVTFMVFGAHHGVARFVARVVPVPAAIVNGHIVWYHEVVERANALEGVSRVLHDDAMARALLLAERSAIIEELAEELHVRTLPAAKEGLEGERSAYFAALTTQAGWTQRDVERYVVDVYARDIAVEEAAFGAAPLQATARAKIESIQIKLQQGIGFADLATEYSEGDAALTAGDIGYVSPEDLPEELRTVAKTIAVDEVSDIVQTHRAFWLVKAEGVIEAEDGTRSVWLRVIEIKKDLLGDIVDERMKTARIREFLR